MAKAVLISLDVDVDDAQQGQPVTVTIGTTTYAGKVDAIIVYTQSQTATKVTLEGIGLKTA